MPIYDYSDGTHQTTRFRKMDERHNPLTCPECGEPMHLIISKTHRQPDGIYSFAPNKGDPNVFERRWENLKAGKRLSDGNS